MNEQKLSTKVTLHQIILRTLGFLFIYVPFVVVLFISEDSYEAPEVKYVLIGILGILVLILLVINFIVPLFIYKQSYYSLDEERLLFQRGVIIKKRSYLPIKRIQHVEKQQGPLQILLKIATVQIFTAGSVVGVFSLDNAVADQLIIELKDRLNLILDKQEEEQNNES